MCEHYLYAFNQDQPSDLSETAIFFSWKFTVTFSIVSVCVHLYSKNRNTSNLSVLPCSSLNLKLMLTHSKKVHFKPLYRKENPSLCPQLAVCSSKISQRPSVLWSHLHAWFAQVPIAVVTPSSSSTSCPSGDCLLLVLAVELFTLPFAVAVVQDHEHAHHPRRHRPGAEDDEADGEEEQVVPVIQSLVAFRAQLHAHLRQALTQHVRRPLAHRLPLI